MTEDFDLFSIQPESSEPYKVKGLLDCGVEQRGDWLQFWADAPRQLHGLQDRSAVMLQLGHDPEKFKLYNAAPFTKHLGNWRTFWYAWPKHLTPYSDRA